MKSGKCPKCGARQIYKQATQGYRSYLTISFWRSTNLTDFVCAQCGCTESYILDDKAKESISKSWEKV